jgi:hypothetical protein
MAKKTNSIKASDGKSLEGRVAIVRVKFTAMSDLIFSKSQYDDLGGYKGFLKEFAISIRDIEKVIKTTMSEHEFCALPDWEG